MYTRRVEKKILLTLSLAFELTQTWKAFLFCFPFTRSVSTGKHCRSGGGWSEWIHHFIFWIHVIIWVALELKSTETRTRTRTLKYRVVFSVRSFFCRIFISKHPNGKPLCIQFSQLAATFIIFSPPLASRMHKNFRTCHCLEVHDNQKIKQQQPSILSPLLPIKKKEEVCVWWNVASRT